MKSEVDRLKFTGHLEALFDGHTTVPCTYAYATEVRLDYGLGALVSNEGYESFSAIPQQFADGRIGVVIINTGNGRQGNIPDSKKDDVLASLRVFWERDDIAPSLRFFIGEERPMSTWAFF